MADLKISQLTGATTPLAGTEVLPVVQSGVTTKISVDNLTAGKTVPTGKIQASSTGEIVKITTSGSVIAGGTNYLRLYDSVGAKGYFGYAGTNSELSINSGAGCYLSLNSVGSNMTLKVGNTTRIDIDTTGNTTLSTGNLIQGTAAKGVNFTANTPATGMTSQLLNWYEEGTWTPTDGSGAGLTFTLSGCVYTRIGRQVTVSGIITFPATASAAVVAISGLPFTQASTTYSTAALASNSGIVATVFALNSKLYLRTVNGGDYINSNLSSFYISFSIAYTV